MTLLRLALFASGNGSNVQAIIDACGEGEIKAVPVIVISNNSSAFALKRAEAVGIPTVHLSSKTHPDPTELDEEMLDVLKFHEVDLVVLAGFNKRLGNRTVRAYRNRIINTHAGLLPKYGGPGMYGLHLHEAVLANGETESGVSIHIVDEEYDHGPTIAQAKVPVLETDDARTLQQRVQQAEHPLFVETLRKIASGDLALD